MPYRREPLSPTMRIDISMDHVTLDERIRLIRPSRISRSQWMKGWERYSHNGWVYGWAKETVNALLAIAPQGGENAQPWFDA